MTERPERVDEILQKLKENVSPFDTVDEVIDHLLHDMAGNVREEMTLEDARQYHAKYFAGMTPEEIQADVRHSGCAFYEALGTKKWIDKVITADADEGCRQLYPDEQRI